MENKNLRDESELVALLKSKSKAGMVRLYDNYSFSLFGVIHKVVKDNQIAEDILQETFIKVWEKIDKYDESKGRLYTWMLNIARNSSIDYIRSKHYKKLSKVQSIDNTVNKQGSSTLGINEDTLGLKELVNKLEPKYKELIDKVYFEGYTQQEVSDELEIPLGTVKTRIRKAILQLKKVFN